jgi:hypothetical protein
MGADRIDHRGLLADEEMARAMEYQATLLLGRLGLDEPHGGPGATNDVMKRRAQYQRGMAAASGRTPERNGASADGG